MTTPYTECNALLAVVNEDYDAARFIIADMLPGERRALITQAHVLADLIQQHNRLMFAVGRPCMWSPRGSRCNHPVTGYTNVRGVPYGICAMHRYIAVDEGHIVFDTPTEVAL